MIRAIARDLAARCLRGGLLLSAACGRVEPDAADPARAPAAVDPSWQALLADAASLETAGDLAGALAKAEAALAGGGGRDAALTVAKLAIMLAQYDRAAAALEPLLRSDPTDAIAQYDLALVHQHRGNYNAARSGYLAALRADPAHADARFNLALLCWKQGVVEEARHHAQKFRERFPTDTRGHELAAMMVPPTPSGAPPASVGDSPPR